MDEALLKKLREVVEANLANEQFSVEDLAASLAYSRSHLHRKLRELTGRSISQFIRSIRLEHGMELLKREVGTVSEISFRIGFGSSTYFIKCFNEEFGFSPGEVKKKQAEGYFDLQDKNVEDTAIQKSELIRPVPSSSPLEVLHPASSESLVREIFDALVVFKPSLEKFLAVDEEEGESIDIRLLAYQIIKSYPWPIGVELRRLFSAALKEQGKERYQQLNKTISRTLQLLAFILASELTELLFKKELKMDMESGKEIAQYWNDLSPSTIVKFLEKGMNILESEKEKLFVPELTEIIDIGFFLEMGDWLKATGKNAVELDSNELLEVNQGLEQTLILLLKKAAILARYRLVNVSSIQVQKSRFGKARFEHHFQILNSSDSEFRLHEEIAEKFSDSNAVLLLKSVKEADRFLNLSPLIIDTHGEDITHRERMGLKRDIYLFEKFTDGKLVYSGSEYVGTENLEELDSYSHLLDEYGQMINLLTR